VPVVLGEAATVPPAAGTMVQTTSYSAENCSRMLAVPLRLKLAELPLTRC